MSTGLIGKASSPESPWSTWARSQSAWQKTSGLAWKLHSEWWHTPRHVACGQATDDRRGQDAPVLPTRGRWSRLRPLWTWHQWKNSIWSMDHCSGSKRSSSTKHSYSKGPAFLKAKGIVFGIIAFSKRNDTDWYRIFCRFLNLSLSWQRNPSPVNHFQGRTFTFCSASLEADCCCECVRMKFVKSLFGSAWIWQSLNFKASKVSSTFLKVQNLMQKQVTFSSNFKTQQIGSHGTHLPTLVLLHGSPMQNVMPQ